MARSPNPTGIDITRDLIDVELDDTVPFLKARIPGAATDALTLSTNGTLVLNGVDSKVARQSLSYWFQTDVAASQSAVALNLDGGTLRAELPMVRAGSVTGIVVFSNAARSGGTLTVDATINGTVTGLTAVLDATNTTVKASTQAVAADAFVAGDRIGVKITTDAGWLPTTADITVVVEISA